MVANLRSACPRISLKEKESLIAGYMAATLTNFSCTLTARNRLPLQSFGAWCEAAAPRKATIRSLNQAICSVTVSFDCDYQHTLGYAVILVLEGELLCFIDLDEFHEYVALTNVAWTFSQNVESTMLKYLFKNQRSHMMTCLSSIREKLFTAKSSAVRHNDLSSLREKSR